MDWGRAKTILILSFLFLNLLLGYQLWVTRWDPGILNANTTAVKAETTKLLETKNIRVLQTIPKEAPKLRQISVKFVDNNRNPDLIPLPTPIQYNHIVGKNTLKDAAVKAVIQNANKYQFDADAGKAGVYIFDQMYENVPMFDVPLQLFVEKAEITGYKQAYVEVQSGVEQKVQKVISAYTALHSLAENYLPAGSVIKNISLGYHGLRFDSETHPMLPYWRIILDNGSSYYVQAFSGAVEGNQEPSKS
ncbi:MAG: YycH-like protein [Bacilli bacterium]|nr:YycH-like protein [Bacilli bacterium]